MFIQTSDTAAFDKNHLWQHLVCIRLAEHLKPIGNWVDLTLVLGPRLPLCQEHAVVDVIIPPRNSGGVEGIKDVRLSPSTRGRRIRDHVAETGARKQIHAVRNSGRKCWRE